MEKNNSFPKDITILLTLSVVLNIARYFIFDSYYFLYLLWNLFLALLPFIISMALYQAFLRGRLASIYVSIGFVIWLVLLPNAPYIVTDIIHLGRNHSGILLFDTYLVFVTAWTGLLLGFYSISHIEKILRSKFSPKKTNTIIILITLFSSFGMYLGRFLRFNSWDVIARPLHFTKSVLNTISYSNGDMMIFTLLSFVFVTLSYFAWRYTQKS